MFIFSIRVIFLSGGVQARRRFDEDRKIFWAMLEAHCQRLFFRGFKRIRNVEFNVLTFSRYFFKKTYSAQIILSISIGIIDFNLDSTKGWKIYIFCKFLIWNVVEISPEFRYNDFRNNFIKKKNEMYFSIKIKLIN